jgi:hypothetical protein
MDKLPIELVYEILAFSGHGTLRYGFPHYDKVIKPCQFIFKLQKKDLKIKPIEKSCINHNIRLQITETKQMEITVASVCGELKHQLIMWHDPNRYLNRSGDFCWHAQECPTYDTIYTEWIRPRPWTKKV